MTAVARRRRFTPEQAAEICALYVHERLPLLEVAGRLDADHTSIAAVLERNGIARRTQLEAVEARRWRERQAVARRLNGGSS